MPDVENFSVAGVPLPVADAQARADIAAINASLTNLIKTSTVSLTSDGNGNAKTSLSTDTTTLIACSGNGFICVPFNGGDHFWYVKMLKALTNPPENYPNLTRDITLVYKDI